MSRQAKHSDFMLKYGDGKYIDKLMRVDVPHWPGTGQAWDAIKPAMHNVVLMAMQNPMISTAAAVKAAALPHEYTPNLMMDHLRTKGDEVHPDVLTAIAKHCGHRDFIRSALTDHENLPKEAYAHLAKHAYNKAMRADEESKPHWDREHDMYLKKSQ